MQDYLISELQNVSLSLFRKDFFGIFHGSISAKTEDGKFIINRNSAIFDKLNKGDFIELSSKKDYRWKDASIDSEIHLNIYENISDARYICCVYPPYTLAYSHNRETIHPKDYFGYKTLGSVEIYNPNNFDDWYERAETEIFRYMKKSEKHLMVIKGFSVYAHGRDINEVIKNIAILENSCKLLYMSKQYK
ncbi:MAG: class II aldolase and adducin N-terminal domain-containing protein [Sulfurospirillaceae bacterium]|nr:class II aldolase and adducin N-terminal domain-containing protein [Sulfurospirillaceae bacterium]